jgi:hypothetical protein
MDGFSLGLASSADLVKEYYECNEAKKQCEAWLKRNKPKIEAAMKAIRKDKTVINEYMVSIVVPNTSKFDMEKVLQYAQSNGHDEVLKQVVDEEALAEAIDNGEINIARLKEVAWVESTGTPRLTIKKVSKEDVAD